MSWYIRHRPKGDSRAEPSVIPMDAPTPAQAVDRVRPPVPKGNVITSVAAY